MTKAEFPLFISYLKWYSTPRGSNTARRISSACSPRSSTLPPLAAGAQQLPSKRSPSQRHESPVRLQRPSLMSPSDIRPATAPHPPSSPMAGHASLRTSGASSSKSPRVVRLSTPRSTGGRGDSTQGLFASPCVETSSDFVRLLSYRISQRPDPFALVQTKRCSEMIGLEGGSARPLSRQ